MNNSIKHAQAKSEIPINPAVQLMSALPLRRRSTLKPRSVVVDDRYGQVAVAGRPEQLL